MARHLTHLSNQHVHRFESELPYADILLRFLAAFHAPLLKILETLHWNIVSQHICLYHQVVLVVNYLPHSMALQCVLLLLPAIPLLVSRQTIQLVLKR